ncbi:MAG: FecR domain-containing protein [Cytophagales bacterium]|nr:FecR domain-containing protein [Cytophagales bacterium]
MEIGDKEILKRLKWSNIRKKEQLFDLETSWKSVSRLCGIKDEPTAFMGIEYRIWKLGLAACFSLAILWTAVLYRSQTPVSKEEENLAWNMQYVQGETNLSFKNGKSYTLSAVEEDSALAPLVHICKDKKRLVFKDVSSQCTVKLSVGVGEIREVVLPDRSVVSLNAGSVLTFSYPFEKKTRRLFMNGEGLFRVQKNKYKPFVVKSPFSEVKVLGTTFNLMDYQKDSISVTSLVEGLVEVNLNAGKKVNKTLNPKQQIVFLPKKTGEKRINLRPFEPETVTTWTRHRLLLQGQPLKKILTKIERFYGFRIKCKDEGCLNARINGMFKRDEMEEFLETLRIMKGWTIDVSDNDVIIDYSQKL